MRNKSRALCLAEMDLDAGGIIRLDKEMRPVVCNDCLPLLSHHLSSQVLAMWTRLLTALLSFAGATYGVHGWETVEEAGW